MKRFTILLLVLLFPIIASAQGLRYPQITTNFFLWADSVEDVAPYSYPASSAILFTNCVAYAGKDTNASVQNLTNTIPLIRIGDLTTNIQSVGWVQVATNGTFSCIATTPAHPGSSDKVWVELRLTNSIQGVLVKYPIRGLNLRLTLE